MRHGALEYIRKGQEGAFSEQSSRQYLRSWAGDLVTVFGKRDSFRNGIRSDFPRLAAAHCIGALELRSLITQTPHVGSGKTAKAAVDG